jgi:hypothetical protein
MNVLNMLHVAAGCVNSPSFAHLLNLVPTDAPLSELRLHPSFATNHFLQPHWLPSLQNLTVLILNGRDIYDPFDLLSAFTRLHTFEADHLTLPWYDLDTNLPLLRTLQKLWLRASSIQWMAGRQLPCLAECAILLPRHWEAVQQHEVHLPSCGKFIYHGYPMTTAQYFNVPQMRAMGLGSHDHRKQRVYQQLCHLFTLDGRVSKLTTLHLTLQCNEQVFLKVLKYLGPLQEFVLSIVHPSLFWKNFLESLAATPLIKFWPEWGPWEADHWEWEQWYSSQTWHANVLPHLKYLGIQSLEFASSERGLGWSGANSNPDLLPPKNIVDPLGGVQVRVGTGVRCKLVWVGPMSDANVR